MQVCPLTASKQPVLTSTWHTVPNLLSCTRPISVPRRPFHTSVSASLFAQPTEGTDEVGPSRLFLSVSRPDLGGKMQWPPALANVAGRRQELPDPLDEASPHAGTSISEAERCVWLCPGMGAAERASQASEGRLLPVSNHGQPTYGFQVNPPKGASLREGNR